jgi:hypothetical protein
MDIYAGKIPQDEDPGIAGDTIVNNWLLPEIHGFRVKFDDKSAMVTRFGHPITAIDISNIWLRTTDELENPDVSVAVTGEEEGIVVTREGLSLLAQTVENEALAEVFGLYRN